MRDALQYLSWVVGIPLNLLVIASLLRGAWRRFPFVLAYSLGLFFTTVVELAAHAGYLSGVRLARSAAFYYWVDEGIRQALLFSVVISLLYLATRGVNAAALLRLALIAGAILFAGTSFLIHHYHQTRLTAWMELWTRDLNFSSALLDLALWTILLATRKGDADLLLLSGALGIQFTGEAIGQTLRNQFQSITLLADVINIAANWACPYIWCHVFRASSAAKASVPARSPHA